MPVHGGYAGYNHTTPATGRITIDRTDLIRVELVGTGIGPPDGRTSTTVERG